MEKKKSIFETLNAINVNEHTEQKNELTYLSWAWAWAEVKKNYPDAFYTIYENKDGWNYHTDGRTCWVKTGVTISGLEHIEYLPVMDYKNKSIALDSVTSFDVNKAIQRSLTKACARHGLGLYIYAGEDLPENDREDPGKAPAKPAAKSPEIEAAGKTADKFIEQAEKFVKAMGIQPEPVQVPIEKQLEAIDAAKEKEEKNQKAVIAVIRGIQTREDLKEYHDTHSQYHKFLWFKNTCNEQWAKLSKKAK